MVRLITNLCGWLAALVVVDGLSAVICVMMALAITAPVGGLAGYFASVAVITVVFTIAGVLITGVYYCSTRDAVLVSLVRSFVRQLVAPLQYSRVAELNSRPALHRGGLSAPVWLASSFYLGGIITMVLRTEGRGGQRERYFWPLLSASATIYALKLALVYSVAGWGAIWFIELFR